MATPGQATYRLRKFRRADPPKRYRATFELSDEHTKQIAATCDVMGHIAFATHEIVDDRQAIWRMAPNRRIMPARWLVSDPDGRVVVQFDQQILRKILNPLRRTGLTLLDAQGDATCRLVDTRTGFFDRLLGPGADDWVLARDGVTIAELKRLPTPKPKPAGLLGHLRNFLTRSDRGLVSSGAEHVLRAPAALALLMLVEDVTNPSAVE